MKLKDAIKEALVTRDAVLAGKVADYCRFRLGMNYPQTFALVQEVRPQAMLAEWDALLYEADETGE